MRPSTSALFNPASSIAFFAAMAKRPISANSGTRPSGLWPTPTIAYLPLRWWLIMISSFQVSCLHRAQCPLFFATRHNICIRDLLPCLPHGRTFLGESARALLLVFRRREGQRQFAFELQPLVERKLYPFGNGFLDSYDGK